MTAIRKGFVTAGAIHGALLTLWLGYEVTGKIYRENLRLDFRISEAAGSQRAGAGSATDQSESENDTAAPEDNGQANTPAAGTTTPGTNPGESGGGYASQNLSAISGMIHGRIHYPRIARRNNWQGKALVHFIVGTDGRTYEVQLKESSGHEVLDESALETVRALDGLPKPPVPVPVTVPVYFRLKPAT